MKDKEFKCLVCSTEFKDNSTVYGPECPKCNSVGDNLEPLTGWASATVKCDLCSHTWLAVYHVDCDKLECGKCGNMPNFEIVENYK